MGAAASVAAHLLGESMSQPPDPLAQLFSMVIDAKLEAGAALRSAMIVQLAILTLMIDAKLIGPEEAIRRIEEIQRALPARYQDEDVTRRVRFLIDWLRQNAGQATAQWKPVVIEGGRDQQPPEPRSPTDEVP